MSAARRRLPFGAEPLDAAHTRFRLWAPDARSVSLVVDGAAPVPLQGRPDGWYELVAAAPAGSRYRYRIDDEIDVPDPASRAQDGGLHGASMVVDPAAYAWKTPQWRGRPWEDAVVYELHAGLYGGFEGVRARLADLARLGVTAVELMPVAQFPGSRNWGYDGVLPFAPAACYGTPGQLKALVDEAHALGLMIFLDVVYNHFGPEGNYLPRYAKAFFDERKRTPWGAGIAFSQAPVREFFLENALYWLHEYRFDGLRIDAAHAIGDPGFLRELVARVRAAHEDGCRRHLIFENEDNDAALLADEGTAQWNDDAHHVLHVLLTGEREGYYADYVERTSARLARWLAEGFVYQGEPARGRQGRPRGTPSAGLRTTAFVNALQNHDQVGNRARGDRIAASVERPALQAAYALLLLVPQIPMLFMGEEWASRVPFRYFTDYHGALGRAVADGRRQEFRHFADFRADDLPDPNAVETFEQSRPDFDGGDAAFRAGIAELIRLRRLHIVPRLRGAKAIGAKVLGHGAVDARWTMTDRRRLRIVVNLSARPVPAEAGENAPFHASTPWRERDAAPAWSCTAWLSDGRA